MCNTRLGYHTEAGEGRGEVGQVGVPLPKEDLTVAAPESPALRSLGAVAAQTLIDGPAGTEPLGWASPLSEVHPALIPDNPPDGSRTEITLGI